MNWKARLAGVRRELEAARKEIREADAAGEPILPALERAVLTLLDCLVRVIDALP